MSKPRRTFIPAAGHNWLLPLYDPITRLVGVEPARSALVDQAKFSPKQQVLDVGCGTGALTIQIKRHHPDIDIVGLDPDPNALARAKRKATRAGVSIRFDEGFSDTLPYRDASFDHVFSSFMFHHLEPGEKEDTLREIRRVLKPGGFFHLLDFGGSEAAVIGLFARLLPFHHRLKDNSPSRILALMLRAGFTDAREVGRRSMFFGTIAYYQASRLNSEASAGRSSPAANK